MNELDKQTTEEVSEKEQKIFNAIEKYSPYIIFILFMLFALGINRIV